MAASNEIVALREGLGVSVSAVARWAQVTVGMVRGFESEPGSEDVPARLVAVYLALRGLQSAARGEMWTGTMPGSARGTIASAGGVGVAGGGGNAGTYVATGPEPATGVRARFFDIERLVDGRGKGRWEPEGERLLETEVRTFALKTLRLAAVNEGIGWRIVEVQS